MELNKIYCMDALEGLKQLPDHSVQLCIIDPPYYKVKDDAWDNQWKSRDEYIDWLETICLEIKRVLKENGSFYVFGDDEHIAYIQVRLDKHFTFLNHLVWYKTNNVSQKFAAGMLKYPPMSERVLFYAAGESKTGLEEIDDKYVRPKHPFAAYLRSELTRAGVSNKEIAALFPSKTGGQTGCVSNWLIGYNCPTPEQYEKIREYLNRGGTEYLRREYEELRREYEELRRPFNYQYGVHEVISEPIITLKENTLHSTTKPVRLIKKLVLASSNEGDVVLDCFMGSGTTALACKLTNRQFIGFEKDERYVELANKRLERTKKQSSLLEVFNETDA